MSIRLAVPATEPGGLEAALMPHFGHCALFTLVDVVDGAIGTVRVVPNPPHGHGGCVTPVNILAEQGVTVMLAGGMGMRPLQALQQSGIEVRHVTGGATVGQVVQAYLDDSLPVFGENGLCTGGCSEHHA